MVLYVAVSILKVGSYFLIIVVMDTDQNYWVTKYREIWGKQPLQSWPT